MDFGFGELPRSELLRRVGHLSQLGRVQLLTCQDGPARGVRVLEFATGSGLVFQVALDRGMDVGYCDYRGASLAWIPPTQMPGGWYHGQEEEFGWLRSALGGFFNTCGLVHIGNPETDSVAHYNFPARPEERYGVHDRAATLPCRLVSYGERWEGDRCVLEAEGVVVQAQCYGEYLVLRRRYRAYLGESRFFLRDEVENAGFLPTVHMLLYHINIGYPVLDQHSEFLAPFAGPPRLLFGEADVLSEESYTRFLPPQKNWTQQTFEHDLQAGPDGRVPVALVNPHVRGAGLGVYVVYSKEAFPTYIEWRMLGEGQYAFGIEPATNGFGRQEQREKGALIVLEPGERRVYETEFGVLDGREEIEAFRARVDGIRGRA
jgi:hypothetical protein